MSASYLAATNSLVSLWRFDPDARKLRVTFSRPQSRPFMLLVRSQVATGPLPFEQSVGLLSVENAANQIGVLGVATGNEVQLDTVAAEKFSPINLEDFPGDVAQPLAAQIPGLTVRRAFRYSDAKATAIAEGVARRAGRARGDAGHPFAGRRSHGAGGQCDGGHHARGHFQIELRVAGGL